MAEREAWSNSHTLNHYNLKRKCCTEYIGSTFLLLRAMHLTNDHFIRLSIKNTFLHMLANLIHVFIMDSTWVAIGLTFIVRSFLAFLTLALSAENAPNCYCYLSIRPFRDTFVGCNVCILQTCGVWFDYGVQNIPTRCTSGANILTSFLRTSSQPLV